MEKLSMSKSVTGKSKMAFFDTFRSVTGDRSRKTPKPSFPCENWGNGKKIDFVFCRVELNPVNRIGPKLRRPFLNF